MERATHTPGPWDYVPYGFDTLAIFANYNAPACDWVEIAQITNDPGAAGKDSQSQANARLIAAAPELLDAIKTAREGIVSGCDTVSTLAKIDRAIAKAEGR